MRELLLSLIDYAINWWRQFLMWLRSTYSKLKVWIVEKITLITHKCNQLCVDFKEWIKKEFERQTKPYLSDYIQQEKKRVLKRIGVFDQYKIEIYQPSIKSFIALCGLIVGVFIFSHWLDDILSFLLRLISAYVPTISFDIPDFVNPEDNHYQNLIAVLAGIGGIVFALTIFIAESFRDGSPDKGRVLLKESLIWPLTVLMVLSFLLFLWGSHNMVIFLPIILVALLSLYSLARVISVMLNRAEFIKKRRQLLKELMQRSIKLAIDSRLADNILLSKLDGKEIDLQYHPFSLDDTEGYICLKLTKFGRIKDINLTKLEDFATLLEKEAVRNGYSFNATQQESQPSLSRDGVSQSTTTQLNQNTRRYILKKYNDEISEESNLLICYEKVLIGDNKKIEARLEGIFQEIFKVGKADSFSEEVRKELQNLRDDFTKSIKEEAAGEVEEHSKTYVTLAEGFLEEVVKFGGGYDYDQARKEITSPFSGWNEVRWLSSDLVDLLELAIKTGNRDVARTVAYTPVAIARRAIEKHDHYVFQEFIRITESLYLLSTRIQDDDNLKEFLIDRSWRYITELCNFYVEHALDKRSLDVKEIESYKNFAVHFLFVFQNLLRTSYTQKDYESFIEFKRRVNKLYEWINRLGHHSDVMHLEYELENLEGDNDRKEVVEKKLERARARENLENELKSRREQMIFGITAFILDDLMRNSDDEELRRFYESSSSSLPNDIEKLTELFDKCHSFDTEDFWKWDWWETRADEGVHSIQVLEKLEQLYAVKALQILAGLSEDKINTISLPPSRDLAFLAEGTRDLMGILENIEGNIQRWNHVVSRNAAEKVNSLRELLLKAKTDQEEIEKQEKIDSNISPKKVAEFKEGVVRSFYEREHAISFFSYIKRFKNRVHKISETLKKNRLGINTVDDKAIFFEDWFVHYGDRGETYGESIASGIDYGVLDELVEKSPTIEFDNLDEYLANIKNIDDIILLCTDTMFVRNFNDVNKFLPHWYRDADPLDVKGFYGWYKVEQKQIPVFEFFHSNPIKHLFVIDKRKFGDYVQDSPLYEGDDPKKIKDIFYLDITAFSDSETLLEEMLEKPPEWLTEIGDREAQIEHLLQRILIKIFVRYHLEWDKDLNSVKVVLREV